MLRSLFVFVAVVVVCSVVVAVVVVVAVYLSIYLSVCLSVCLSVYLQSANLKTKLFCETSSAFELDNVKREAILRDFLKS